MHESSIRVCLILIACLGGIVGAIGQVQAERKAQSAAGESGDEREQRRSVRRLGDIVSEDNGEEWSLDIPAAPESAASATPEDRSRQEELETLFGHANDALDQGRIAAPAGDNAREYFERILRLDPENAAALDGLEEVERRLCFTGRGTRIRTC